MTFWSVVEIDESAENIVPSFLVIVASSGFVIYTKVENNSLQK